MLSRLRETVMHALRIPRIRVRPDDCFLVSWPRSGNTWLTHMLIEVMDTDGAFEGRPRWLVGLGRSFQSSHLATSPMLSPRVFKSHERFVPAYLRGRVAYLVRHGLDATASYFDYRTKMSRSSIDWETFLDRCLTDRVRHGGWHRHVESWLAHRDHPSVLVVRYEDLLADTATELARVLDHFGVASSRERIDRAVEQASIEAVHNSFRSRARHRGRSFSGGLGGGSGRWRERFSEPERRRFLDTSGAAMSLLGYTAERPATEDQG
jgi:hypothetical protein